MKPSLFGKDRICAVIAARTAREAQGQIRKALHWARIIELRLDWLRNWDEIVSMVRWLLKARLKDRSWQVIATLRRQSGGGRFRGSLIKQLACLKAGLIMGDEICDLEVETVEPLWKTPLRRELKGIRPLISYHNLKRTPASLVALARKLKRFDGRAIKIATHCNSIADSLRVLRLAKGRNNVVAVPMGEVGLPARVLALREGSALAYASVGEATASGQLTLDEMKNLYRADQLDRKTRVYGVIGNPVAHSLSPVLQNAGFHARKINAVYLPFLVKELNDFMRAIEPLGIAGFSVTLPYKEKIVRHLDDCDPLAAAIGAVNTVVVRGGGKLYGVNTDYVGVLRALERRVPLAGSRVLLYGAGGAARAAAFALAQGGAVVCVCARRPQQVKALAKSVGGVAIARAGLRREYFDAIVNTTPVGMHPRAGESPLTAAELNARVVMDMIYRPQKTKLLQLAERRGIETIGGLEMFLAQGTAQWEIWTQQRAPEAVMRRAVAEKLRQDGK